MILSIICGLSQAVFTVRCTLPGSYYFDAPSHFCGHKIRIRVPLLYSEIFDILEKYRRNTAGGFKGDNGKDSYFFVEHSEVEQRKREEEPVFQRLHETSYHPQVPQSRSMNDGQIFSWQERIPSLTVACLNGVPASSYIHLHGMSDRVAMYKVFISRT